MAQNDANGAKLGAQVEYSMITVRIHIQDSCKPLKKYQIEGIAKKYQKLLTFSGLWCKLKS